MRCTPLRRCWRWPPTPMIHRWCGPPTTDGLLRSDDGGAQWQPVVTDVPVRGVDLATAEQLDLRLHLQQRAEDLI
jgi:hypothetical protein